MRRPAAFFPIVLALGAIILAPVASARADGREEGPREIEKCQTIDQPGSYKLVHNLTARGDCLVITANFVTIDLTGFVISGNGTGTGVVLRPPFGVDGTAIRNGSITNFDTGVLLVAEHSSVEGLRVTGNSIGVIAAGIVKGNIVWANDFGMEAGGVVTGNNASGNGRTGILADFASTVIGNRSFNNGGIGLDVFCPSNVTDNTAVSNGTNLMLNGTGCNNTNNVAP
jgi:hypothetical protein